MMSKFEETVETLSQLTNPLMIYAAEKRLNELAKEQFFLKILSQIATSNESIAQQVRHQATIQLSRLLFDQATFKEEVYLIDVVMQVAYDWTISQSQRRALEKGITMLFQWCDVENNAQIYQSLLALVDAYTNCIQYQNRQKQGQNIQIISQIEGEEKRKLLYQYKSSKIPLSFQIYQRQDYSPIIKTILMILRCLIQTETQRQFADDLFFKSVKECYQIILVTAPIEQMYQVLTLWHLGMENLKSKNTEQDYLLLKFMCQSDKLIIAIIFSFIYKCKNQNCAFIQLESPNLLQKIIPLKKQAAEIAHFILQFTQQCQQDKQNDKNKDNRSQENNNKIVNAFYPYMVRTSLTIMTYARFQDYFENTCQQFILELLMVFTFCYKRCKQLFVNTFIIQNIVFKLIEVRDDQLLLFENQSQQFISVMEDCCEHQNYNTIKAKACTLLQKITDMDHQAAYWCISLCVQSLTQKLSGQNSINSNILSFDQSLFVLSVLSYRLIDFPVFKNQIQTLFSLDFQYKLTPFQVSRMFLFLTYHDAGINNVNRDKQITFGLLFSQQQNSKAPYKHRTIISCAYIFLLNVVESYLNNSLLIALINRLPQVPTQHALIKILNRILALHLHKISQQLLILMIQKIYEKMKNELKAYFQQSISNTQQIANCLQFLRMFLKQYMQTQIIIPNALRLIWRVTEFYEPLTEVYLCDEVALVVRDYLNVAQQLSQSKLPYIPINSTIQNPKVSYNSNSQYTKFILQMASTYHKTSSTHSIYIVIFNNFIMNAVTYTEAQAQLINNVIIATENIYLKFSKEKTVKLRLALANHFILLQNVLAKLFIELHLIQRIKQVAKAIIPIQQAPQQYFQKVLITRAINILILCSLNGSDTFALVYLYRSQFEGYEARVMLQCLQKHIFAANDVILLTQLLKLMIEITSMQWKTTKHNKKINLQSKMVQDNKITIKKTENFERILDSIQTPFHQSSPYDYFLRKTIEKMKQNNYMMYQAIVSSFPQETIQTLKNILSSTIIHQEVRKMHKIKQIKNQTIIQFPKQTKRFLQTIKQEEYEEKKKIKKKIRSQ